MKRIEGNYYEHEGELYKKLKGTPRGYHIINEEGKQSWLRLKCTDCTRTDCTPQPNDLDVCCTESTPVQPVQDVQIVQDTIPVQGVQCTDSTEEYPDNDEGYGTIGDIERRTPRTPVRNMYEDNDKIYEPDENGIIW